LKKFIATALLMIYLFNIGGQLMLHQYFVFLSDKLFNEQAAKGRYNVADLTEVKIPVNMPQMTDWQGYENITGQIQFGDISYNYVKMRVTRHTLYLMCIPNYAATHLSDQNVISVKQIKRHPLSPKNHVPYGKMLVLNKFDYTFLHFEFTPSFENIPEAIVQPVQLFDYYSPNIPEKPPKFSC